MKDVLLVASLPEDAGGSAAPLADAFTQSGWRATLADHRTTMVTADGLLVRDREGRDRPMEQFSRVWLLGLGPRRTFLDRMQAMSAALPASRFVNSPLALLRLHAKYQLALEPAVLAAAGLRHPATFAGADAAALARIIQREGGEWVLKPPAGSHGTGIRALDANDPGLHAVLLSAIGPGDFVMIQPRIRPRAAELRVLVANGRVVGCYARDAAPAVIAHNLAAGARPRPATLTSAQRSACELLARHWVSLGIRWAGFDLADDWIFEVNVANPGGIATLAVLGDRTAAMRAVEAIATGPG